MNLHERGNFATLGSVHPHTLPNEKNGTICLETIKSEVPSYIDEHVAKVTGVSLENSHNQCGGRVLPPDYVTKLKQHLKKHKVKLHLDGARAWNAAVALD